MSIIIPAYNTAPYIHRAINSSLRQTHTKIEVLVIDDGSSDDTLSAAESFALRDGRVRALTQANAGVSAARNYGIREARGEYLIFLDSDDWLEDDAVETFLAAQAEYPDKLITAEKYFAEFGKDGRIYRERQPAKMKPQVIDDISKAIADFWNKANLQTTHYKIFSAETIRKHNVHFREGIHNHEDGLFVFDYLHGCGGIVYMDKALWTVLHRQGSAMRSGYSHRLAESVIEADKIMMSCPQNTPEVNEFCAVYHAFCMTGLRSAVLKAGAGAEEEKYILDDLRLYAGKFLRSKNMSLLQKAKFLSILHLPSWIFLLLVKLKNFLEGFLSHHKGELAAEWLQPH